MPNWCSNFVTFQGDEANIKRLRKALKKHKKEEEGFILPCVKIDKCNSNPYIFELYDEESDTIQFETKWSPNIDAIHQIAKHYKLNYEHEYEEMGCLLYGKTVYKDGELSTYDLEQPDFDLYERDEVTDLITYQGREWQSEACVLEDILDNKYPNMVKL